MVEHSPGEAGRPHLDRPPYALTIRDLPRDLLYVHRFSGKERLSRCYSFDIVVSAGRAAAHDLDAKMLGRRAALTFEHDHDQRTVHGVVAAIRCDGPRTGDGRFQYRLRVVPALWTLGRTRRSRIFQEVTVREVLERVLPGHSLRWEVSRPLPTRAYVTQYRESDLTFVQRLLAESGIFYTFLHPTRADATEVMLLGDSSAAYSNGPDWTTAMGHSTKRPAALHFVERGGLSADRGSAIVELAPSRSVRPTAAEHREYDPARPDYVYGGTAPARVAAAALDALTGAASLSVAVPEPGVGAAADALLGAVVDLAGAASPPAEALEVYEHDGRFHFTDWSDATSEAGRILARARRRASVARGRSLSPSLFAGKRFTVEGHPLFGPEQELAVTAVRHRGAASEDEVYGNEFECVPAEVPYLPSSAERTVTQSTETATVVGPPGEEVHVDGSGRIKVHFHWDRVSPHADSSCWIRCLQAWGGAGWGAQFIPRVGMEVVVGFDGGDPDRPIVLGCLYNATHPMPFALPRDKTRSGIRTRSVPGTTGSNELSFEDARGAEQIFVHAERDLDVVAKNDRSARVARDDSRRVGRDAVDDIAGNARHTVRGDARHDVMGNAAASVGGNVATSVRGDHQLSVGGSRLLRISGSSHASVTGDALVEHAGDEVRRTSGHSMTVVGAPEAKTSHALHVEGTSTFFSTGPLELTSEREIVLRVGKTCLRLGPDRIDVVGASIGVAGGSTRLDASNDGASLVSPGVISAKSNELLVSTSGASIRLKEEVRLDGKRILLNAPDHAREEPVKLTPPTRFELRDQDGAPIAGARYLLTLEDGGEQTGVLGEDGAVDLVLPKSGLISFPDLLEVNPG